MKKSKLAVIIGGSKGIGEKVLEEYYRKGYKLMALGRNRPKSKVSCIDYIEMNIDDQIKLNNAINQLIEKINMQDYIEVSVFFVSGSSLGVNDGNVGELDHLTKLNQVVLHNTTMPYWATKKITQALETTSILLEFHYLSSSVAINMSMHGIYNASKHSLEHLVISLMKERRSNIYHFGYRLGIVKVEHKYFARLEREEKGQFDILVDKRIPSGYMSTPEDIARFVMNATEHRDLCNGMICDISGGHSWI